MTFRWRLSARAQALVIGVAALAAATTPLHAQEPTLGPDIPQQPIKPAAERSPSPPKPQTPPTPPTQFVVLHSYVSGRGADNHSYCTLAAPCRTFQFAHDRTAAGGEVTALDSADYGPLTITKAINIDAPSGVEASIDANPGQFDINIVAGPADTVELRGLTLEGAGQSSSGIRWVAGLRLEVIDCVVRNFSNYGLDLAPENLSSFLVSNTVVSDNGQSGIYVGQSDTNVLATNIIGSIVNTTIVNNNVGVSVYNITNAEIQLSGDHIDNNVSAGVKGGMPPYSTNTGSISLILKDVTLNQTPIGVDLTNGASVWMSHVTQAAVPGFGNFASVVFEAVRQQSHAFSDGTNLLSTGLVIRMSDGGLVSGGAFEVWPKQ